MTERPPYLVERNPDEVPHLHMREPYKQTIQRWHESRPTA